MNLVNDLSTLDQELYKNLMFLKTYSVHYNDHNIQDDFKLWLWLLCCPLLLFCKFYPYFLVRTIFFIFFFLFQFDFWFSFFTRNFNSNYYTFFLLSFIIFLFLFQGDIEDLSLTFSVSETAMGVQKEVDLVHLGSKTAVIWIIYFFICRFNCYFNYFLYDFSIE